MAKSFVAPLTFVAALAAALFTLLAPSVASAADPWVDRRLTLPKHDWAFDMGLGVGHYRYSDDDALYRGTGPGLNLEGKVSVIHHLELGFRSGLRFGNDGRRVGRGGADYYGRLFDRQTYGVRDDTFANPEVRVRGQLLDLEVFELALEGRAYLPFEENARFGMMFGVPLALHLGSIVRLDTGLYVPVVFYTPAATAISVPVDVWFQVTRKLWLGPLTGFEVVSPNSVGHFSLGFGLGYQVASFVDLKTMLLFPRLDEDRGSSNFGVGVGVQLRIE